MIFQDATMIYQDAVMICQNAIMICQAAINKFQANGSILVLPIGDISFSTLIEIISVFNVALLAFVVVHLVRQTSMGAMQTAHEGVSFGRRYHAIWTPVRAPLAIFFLTPLPVIKGLTVLQAFILGDVYISVALKQYLS
jgi:conjugal transfer/type IV secretion protein DotA/TraY